MNKKQEQLTFLESRVIKDGVSNGNVWQLYGYKTEDGKEYSSFDAYPLNLPMFIEYSEEEVPSRDGKRTFINRKLIRTIVKANPPVSDTQKIIALLEEIQSSVEDIKSKVLN